MISLFYLSIMRLPLNFMSSLSLHNDYLVFRYYFETYFFTVFFHFYCFVMKSNEYLTKPIPSHYKVSNNLFMMKLMKMEHLKPSNTTNMSILQTGFDWKCLRTVMRFRIIFTVSPMDFRLPVLVSYIHVHIYCLL